MAKVRENQIFEGTQWHDFTDKNHLIAAYDFDPVQVFNRLEQVLDVNLGENFVSMIMKHGIHYIDRDKDFYEWYIENTHSENYELLGAFEDPGMARAIGTTAGLRLGTKGTEFYMLFDTKPFGINEIIVGMKPDLYRLWITEDPRNVGGDRWLYKVQLISDNDTDFIPVAEVYNGSRWSNDGGLTVDQMSYTGFGPDFRSHSMLRNNLSQFRMKHRIPGNMFDVKPMYFYIREQGKTKKLWLNNVEYEFLKKARWASASIIMNGHSNVKADGTITNIDQNGFTATTGSGFKEQWLTSNKHVWNTLPDLDFLNEIALDATVGKVAWENRKMVIKAGEYGLTALSNMVTLKYGAGAWSSYPWAGDATGRAFSWSGNELKVKTGQIMGVATISGIEFNFVIDPQKDDLKRNKIMHPLGGPASSYEYDIMGFGTKDEKSNMQIVRRSGETPQWGVEEGMRGFYKEKGSFMMPKRLSTAVDASTIHYLEPGIGAIVWDPTKIVRYYPEITQL